MRNTKCVSKRFALDESQAHHHPHPHTPRHSRLPQPCFKNLAEEWNENESMSLLIYNKLSFVQKDLGLHSTHESFQWSLSETSPPADVQLSIPTLIYFIWVLPEAQRCVFTEWFCCKIWWIHRGSRGKLQEPVSDPLLLHQGVWFICCCWVPCWSSMGLVLPGSDLSCSLWTPVWIFLR